MVRTLERDAKGVARGSQIFLPSQFYPFRKLFEKPCLDTCEISKLWSPLWIGEAPTTLLWNSNLCYHKKELNTRVDRFHSISLSLQKFPRLASIWNCLIFRKSWNLSYPRGQKSGGKSNQFPQLANVARGNSQQQQKFKVKIIPIFPSLALISGFGVRPRQFCYLDLVLNFCKNSRRFLHLSNQAVYRALELWASNGDQLFNDTHGI